MFEEIWNIVRPKGQVATYGDVAKAARFPGADRQVVCALRASKRPRPWHRVLGANRKIRLPREPGLEQRVAALRGGQISRGSSGSEAGRLPRFSRKKVRICRTI